MARAKGFKHRCPLCGAENALRAKLADVNSLECGECSEELNANDVKAILENWTRILAWLETAPLT